MSFWFRHHIQSAPIVNCIYPNFKVSTATPSLHSSSLHLLPLFNNKQQESYDFDNDDFDLDELLAATEPVPVDSDTMEIDLIVKNTSISVNNLHHTYNIPSTIRSCCVLKGKDDTLLLCLKTGYLLVVKFYIFGTTIAPRVIQDIKLSHNDAKITNLGRSIHASAKLIAIASQSLNIRFCQLDNNDRISHSINFIIDGTILLNTFIHANPNHLMFLSLIITSARNLQFRLFEKWDDDSLDHIQQYSPILLPADFQIPKYLTAVKDIVVLIYPHSITLAGLNYLISYDLSNYQNFEIFDSMTSITNYCLTDDTLLISTNKGSVYSVHINGISEPVLKVIYQNNMPITNFSISQTDGLDLILSTSNSLRKVSLDQNHHQISSIKQNWLAPVLDFTTITNNKKQQELWVLAQSGPKKTSLVKLNYSLKLNLLINDDFFKAAEQIWKIDNYLLFNFKDHSSLYQFHGLELILLESSLTLDSNTLLFTKLSTFALHVAQFHISLYDIDSNQVICNRSLTQSVILAHSGTDSIALITRDIHLEILRVANNEFESVFRSKLNQQPSMVKFIRIANTEYLMVGFFNNDMMIIDLQSLQPIKAISISTMNKEFLIPHDAIYSNGSIIISSKNGMYCIISDTKTAFIKVSETPIKIVSTQNEVVLISQKIYKLNLEDSIYPQKYDLENLPNFKCHDLVVNDEKEFLILSNMGFGIISGASDQPVLVPMRKYKFNNGYTRLINLTYSKFFILLASVPTEEPLILMTYNLKKLPIQDTKWLSNDEVILSVEEWKFEYCNEDQEMKCHLQLLIGCYDTVKMKSCIKVVELKRDADDIKLNKLFQWNCSNDTDNRISFIRQFSNNLIIYCIHNELYKIFYNFVDRKFEKPELINSFKDKINAIDLNSEYIAVSILNDSFVVLRYTAQTQEFQIHFKDNFISNIYQILMVADKLVISDKYRSIIRVYDTADFTGKQAVYQTDSLVKFCKCDFRSRWSDEQTRFLACSLDGEVSVFTEVSVSQHKKMQDLVSSPDDLYQLGDKPDWFLNDVGNVVDSDRLRRSSDLELDAFMTSLYI